jgi:DNA topoisomerase-1
VNLETALQLLSLPRTVGEHPESKEPILAANGRFGPYIKCGTDTRSIPTELSVLSITLQQAVDILKQPKTRGRQAAPAAPLAEVGTHPNDGTTLVVRSGRYGPYVTDGTVNASLPKGADPTKLTLEEAVNLIEARKIRLAEAPPKEKKKKAPAKKAPTKKAPTEKEGSKKGEGAKAKKTATKKKSAE